MDPSDRGEDLGGSTLDGQLACLLLHCLTWIFVFSLSRLSLSGAVIEFRARGLIRLDPPDVFCFPFRSSVHTYEFFKAQIFFFLPGNIKYTEDSQRIAANIQSC